MELQTKPALRTRTPRVKAISDAAGYPEILVCLFTGEIQLYNKDTLQLTRSAQIGNTPIRTGVLVPSQDWILLGTDDGHVIVLDLGNLSMINQVPAHDDFIRKIVLDENNKRFITVSDDNTAKLWSYDKNINLVNKYKANHFVMDACFCPSDHTLFITVCLDAKAYLYSIQHEKCLKKFKGHEKGINCITFVGTDLFATGSDDHTIIVWDYKRGTQVTRLRGHTNNVNSIHKIKNGFASCSEDSTVRIWSDDFRTTDVKNLAGRVWALLEREGRVFMGSDEELVVFLEQKAEKIAALSDSRIFYNTGNLLKAIKLEEREAAGAETREGIVKDVGSSKEVGSLEDGFRSFVTTKNGKFVAVLYNEYFTVYSSLGLRKKITEAGKDFIFVDNDSFVFRNENTVLVYSRFEMESSARIEGLSLLLFADDNILVVNKKKTCVYDRAALLGGGDESASLLHEFDLNAKKAFCFNEYLVLIGDTVSFYDANFDCIGTLDHQVESFCVQSDFLYFSTAYKTFYSFIIDGQVKVLPMRFIENIFGASNDSIFFLGPAAMAYKMDSEFLEFQMAVFKDLNGTVHVGDLIADKAISFYESLGMHERALGLCKSENQKFEILLKLENFDEAFRMANSPIKFKKLGISFLKNSRLDMAAQCFSRAGDMNSLLLVDVFGEKKYLKEVGDVSRRKGENNIAFMAYFKNESFKECSELLRDSPFFDTFNQFYCN